MKALKLTILSFLIGTVAIAQSGNEKPKRNYGTTAEDSIECVKNLSLYSEFYKQDNFEDALLGWRSALAICPGSSKNLYIRGSKMMNYLMEKADEAENEELKDALVDTLLNLYDLRIANFGEEGKVLGMKGVDLMKYRKKDPAAAFEILNKSFELDGNNIGPAPLVYLFLSKYYMVAKKLSEKKELIELYPRLVEVVDFNIAEKSKYAKTYETAGANLLKLFEKVATCEDIIGLYQPTFEEMKGDAGYLKKVISLLDKRKCAEEELYLNAAIALNEIEPSAEASYSIAIGMIKKERYSEAISFFSKSIEFEEDNSKNFDAYVNKAKALLISKRFQEAKNAAKNALGINPNSGDAYMIIGDSYGYGGKSCYSDGCKVRAGWWLATDYYQKAKSVDAEVAEKANKKIAQAKSQYPSTEDCFFYGLTNDNAFSFEDCWITESTTVRVQ